MKKKEPRRKAKTDPNIPWREMDEYDIYKLKLTQCQYCEYFTNITSKAIGMGTCDYIGRTGHSRRCSPLECTNLGIFKRREGKRDEEREEECLED